MRKAIPESIKRALRQEAQFGCVICGCPIIEYHHIEPYSVVGEHEPSNLVVLCPTDHHRADCNELSTSRILEAKKNPFNAKTACSKQDISFGRFDDLVLIIGGNRYINNDTILEIDDVPIIYVKADSNGYTLFCASFYDTNNNLLAEIRDNEWIAYLDNNLWDIQYKPGHLKIYNQVRHLLLELESKQNIIEMRATINYNGHTLYLLPNESIFGGMSISGSTFEGQRCAIRYRTK